MQKEGQFFIWEDYPHTGGCLSALPLLKAHVNNYEKKKCDASLSVTAKSPSRE